MRHLQRRSILMRSRGRRLVDGSEKRRCGRRKRKGHDRLAKQRRKRKSGGVKIWHAGRLKNWNAGSSRKRRGRGSPAKRDRESHLLQGVQPKPRRRRNTNAWLRRRGYGKRAKPGVSSQMKNVNGGHASGWKRRPA